MYKPIFVSTLGRGMNRFIVVASILLMLSCRDRFSMYPIRSIEQPSEKSDRIVEDFLNNSLEKYPSNVELGVERLKYFQKKGWSTEAEQLMSNLLKLDSANYNISELATDYYLSQGELDKALIYADRAEILGAQSAGFYQMKAQLFSQLGEYDQAIDYINKAILINRSDFSAYYTKGKIYLTLGDTLSGLKFLEMSLSHYRTRHEVLYEISDIYESMGEYARAEELIVAAMQYAPESEKLIIKRAGIQKNGQRFVDAKQTLWKSFSQNEAHLESGMALSYLYFELTNYDSAIAVSNMVQTRDTSWIEPVLLNARAYDKKYFLTTALRNYEKVIELDSTHEEAQSEMQKVLGKIAYLRKLREAKEAMPVFDFMAPKKNK